MQACSVPKFTKKERRRMVAQILTPWATIPNAAFSLTRRTAVKYPERQEESATGTSVTASIRNGRMARVSPRIFNASGFERESKRTVATIPVIEHTVSACFTVRFADFESPMASASDTSFVVPRLIPDIAIVIEKPYILPRREKSPIASLPALLETYMLKSTLTPRRANAVAVRESAFRKNLLVLDGMVTPDYFV